jgi:hypothetical protein
LLLQVTTRLDRIGPSGWQICAFPLKIVGDTGAPLESPYRAPYLDSLKENKGLWLHWVRGAKPRARVRYLLAPTRATRIQATCEPSGKP